MFVGNQIDSCDYSGDLEKVEVLMSDVTVEMCEISYPASVYLTNFRSVFDYDTLALFGPPRPIL